MEQLTSQNQTLMAYINPSARQLIDNIIIQNMNVIDWGKSMAKCNEIIQKEVLKYSGIDAYDPETDVGCPEIDTANNSPGFDLIVKKNDGTIVRIQSKLRQVKGMTDFSRQTHFETTRRHSKKNKGVASESGHIAYGCDEFDYVMVSLVNVGNQGEIRTNRNDVDKWSFTLIPVNELINKETQCCITQIPSNLLEQYKFDPKKSQLF